VPPPRNLIHSEWFDYALQLLGDNQEIDEVLARDFYRIACYADLVPVINDSSHVRVFRTEPMVREDGQIVRIFVYFVLRDNHSVELQHIEAVDQRACSLRTRIHSLAEAAKVLWGTFPVRSASGWLPR